MDARQKIIFEHELDTRDFATLIDTLNSAGFKEGSAARQLATIGRNIVELDAEEFEQDASRKVLPKSISDQLRLCAWPRTQNFAKAPPFVNLIPTFELLLELLEVQIKRRDWTAVLATIHLMSEYMPFLAVQSLWRDAGRPDLLILRLQTTCLNLDATHVNKCQLSLTDKEFARNIKVPSDAGQLQRYLSRSHSRMAAVVLKCPDMATNDPANLVTLKGKFNLITKFRDSQLIKLRHSSPVGHFFAVPAGTKIKKEWRAYAERRNEEGTYANALSPRFPEGVADLVTAVAGSPTRIKQSNILEPLAVEIRAQVAVTNSQPE